jgi:hypothetical protein
VPFLGVAEMRHAGTDLRAMDSNADTSDGPLAHLGREADRNRMGSQTGSQQRQA